MKKYSTKLVYNTADILYLQSPIYFIFNTDLWIGASDVNREGIFLWDNGAVSVSRGYTNWYPGEPNNINGGENCMVYYIPYGFAWNDGVCNTEIGGICEAQP